MKLNSSLILHPSSLLLVLVLVLAAPLLADDWPSWRGVNRDGICKETGLLKQWPEGGPKLLWTAHGLGEGFSGPAIVGDRLYTMGNRDGQEWVIALDLAHGGKIVWSAPIGSVRHDGGSGGKYPGPRSTPSIDGNRLYTLGINGDLVCMDRADGKIIWRHDLVGEFGGETPRWGYAESVLIDGPWLICTPGKSQATILALDKLDGKPVWQSKVGDPAGYSSVVIFTAGEVKQYVTLTARGVIGVAANDGKFLWRYDAPANKIANVATCVTYRQSVFAASAYGVGGGLALIKKTGDEFTATEMYFTPKMQNHHGGLVLVDGALYGCDNPDILTCLDYRTGKIRWTDRSSGKCSILLANGQLYCRSERGAISLVDATPDGFHLHGRFNQPSSSRSSYAAWPHLVIADGKLYVRDQDVMLCYQVGK